VLKAAELFPVRNVWLPTPPYEDYFPSDLYFADVYDAEMNFSSWDANGNGKFAEYPADMPAVDVLPDVYLGKIPCNNVRELNNVIDKIIYYKEHNKMTKKILQMGGDSLPGNGFYEGEYANEKVLETLPGYTANQLWGTNGKLTKANIGKGFRANVDFVDFSGHGSYTSWATHPPDDSSVWIPPKTLISFYTGFLFVDVDLYIRNNPKKYPVVVFTACSNNKYTESPDCIGWRMLGKKNAGGIATFAESGIGLGPGGAQFVTVGIGWLEVNIFKNIYNSKNLGIGWADTINGYYTEHGPSFDKQDYQTMLEFSMFGDPTVIIDDGDDPVNIPLSRHTIFSFFERFLGHFPIISKIIERIKYN
jgi:hypothetical protein